MLLPLAYYGNPVLRKKATQIEKIDDSIRQLAADMIETMHATNGIGLAATQIAQLLSIFVTCVPIAQEDGSWIEGKDRVFINPKILTYSQEFHVFSEGCLSIPKLFANVARPERIKIQAMDLEGHTFEETMTGYEATNFMHENDHLNGVLFIDRLERKERKKIEPILQQIKKKYALKN
ncbi:peptide deformylase [Parachlamydia sp. AcF125]|uniref:peptide deformylase n=1 Tax=Parachlamydia sp. AcF125 TaxID=2795736 RepID=UPI001BCA1C8C|nr:peptide deformylase [Parachlamydia sp. AcF125]MBS4168542.1 Peptide deformylase [Parachlamydia sp. AcF125]